MSKEGQRLQQQAPEAGQGVTGDTETARFERDASHTGVGIRATADER